MDAEERQARVLQYIREKGPVTPKQVRDDLGINRNTLALDTRVMRAAGLIRYHLGIVGILEANEEKEG